MAGSRNNLIIKCVTAIYLLFLAAVEILAGHYIRPWDLFPWGDKIAHFILVGLLCLLVNLSLNGAMLKLWVVRVRIGSLTVAILATMAELSQSFLATRTCSMTDLAVSYLGIVCFGYFSGYLNRRAVDRKQFSAEI